MNFIRKKVLNGELVFGTWCNLGNSLTVEMAGYAGFDWVLIDMEHGASDYRAMVYQLQAATCTPSAPLVRIVWNEPPIFKRVLDMGASGIMVPYVSTGEEARLAASAMRYPPQGIRGVAKTNRATSFGRDFADYFARANDNLLTVVQIESGVALDNIDEIAAVEGIDVLFIGPLDLTTNLGIQDQYDHPLFREALKKVVQACRNAGKAPGILLGSKNDIQIRIDDGFTFIALGADGGMVAAGMQDIAAAFKKYKE